MGESRLNFDRRAFLAGGAALGLSACAPRAGRTRLVLGDQVQLQQAQLHAAGQLDDLSYDIQWANFPAAAPLIEALNAGALDVGIAGDLPVILAAAAGVPLKLVAAARSSPRGVAILVPGGSPLSSVAALRGRRVIVSAARGSIAHYLLAEALHEADVPLDAVSIGFMSPNDATAAFAAGQVEAWATFGVYQASAEAAGARVLRDGRGIYTGLGLIAASRQALGDEGKRFALSDYLRRLARANIWARQNPEAYAQIYSERTKVPLAISRVVVERQQQLLEPVDAAVVSQLQRVSDNFYGVGELPAAVDVASFVDSSLFTRA